MKTFVLLERKACNTDCPSRIEWWEKSGEKLYNSLGSWNRLSSLDTILETVEAKNWNNLLTKENIAKTSAYKELIENSTDKSLKIGWLEPNGEMHYCGYREHIDYVHTVLGSDVPTIESQGWIHIYAESTVARTSNNKRMTQAQARTAREELGLKVFEDDILES